MGAHDLEGYSTPPHDGGKMVVINLYELRAFNREVRAPLNAVIVPFSTGIGLV